MSNTPDPTPTAQAAGSEFADWPRTDDGRLICSPKHPLPVGNGNAYGRRWAHTNCGEVGPQKGGYPCGDYVTMACNDCGLHWEAELPQ